MQPQTRHRTNGTAAVLPLTPAEPPPPAPPQAATISPAVYTADELARLLAVSRRAVERWEAAGKLPPEARLRLPGRVVRYRRDVIDRWLEAGCPAPPRPRRR